jgi:hypothetical protein
MSTIRIFSTLPEERPSYLINFLYSPFFSGKTVR